MTTPLVSFCGVTKLFGDVRANDAVNLDIRAGEVLALLGENGAGKSTLMRILYGMHQPDAGDILIDGRPAAIASPRDAMAAGIGMVFQQFSLIPALSVLENLLVAWPPAPWWQGRGSARLRDVLGWLDRLAPGIDPARRVGDLAVGERQLVELAKVLNLDPRIVILDEPTSVLTPAEATRLHGFVRELAAGGRAVVLITHKIADVTACADRIAVMRHGRLVDAAPLSDRTPEHIVATMIGRDAGGRLSPPPDAGGVPRLQIVGLSTPPGDDACPVRDVSLDIAGGEILGIAGVVGNGQTALAEAVTAVAPVACGDVVLDGVSIAWRDVGPPRVDTVAYIPERPLDNAVVGDLDVATNLDLRHLPRRPLFAGLRDRFASAAGLVDRFDVRPRNVALPARSLSGGNLQKLVIARELSGEPALIVACYPTMGLDIGAARAVYEQLFAHAARGAAVLWISEDLDDLLAYAHRIAVLADGRIAGVVPRVAATRDGVGRWMIGAGPVTDAAAHAA